MSNNNQIAVANKLRAQHQSILEANQNKLQHQLLVKQQQQQALQQQKQNQQQQSIQKQKQKFAIMQKNSKNNISLSIPILSDEQCALIVQQSTLTCFGYSIPKLHEGISLLLTEEIQYVKKQLTIIKQGYNAASSFQIVLWRESANYWHLPKGFAFERYGMPHTKKTPEPEFLPIIPFIKPLRPYQVHIVEKFAEYVEENAYIQEDWVDDANQVIKSVRKFMGGGCILEIPCGKGKTIMFLYIITQILKMKSLIVVHQRNIGAQHQQRIRACCPAARIGFIQGQTFDIENKDIVIATVQTLSDGASRGFTPKMFQSFGLMVIDEAHRIVAQKYSQIYLNIQIPYLLAVSATIDRTDHLSDVLYPCIGPKLFSEKRKGEEKVIVRAFRYTPPHTYEYEDCYKVLRTSNGDVDYTHMIGQIATNIHRQMWICDIIEQAILEYPDQKDQLPEEENTGICEQCYHMGPRIRYECDHSFCSSCFYRQVGKSTQKIPKCPCCSEPIVLPDEFCTYEGENQIMLLALRRETCNVIYQTLKDKGYNVELYVGGTPQLILQYHQKAQILVATYFLASTAVDIPTLSGVAFIEPYLQTEQPIGRMLRTYLPGARVPKRLFDIIDPAKTFTAQWYARKKQYNGWKYDVHIHTMEQGINHNLWAKTTDIIGNGEDEENNEGAYSEENNEITYGEEGTEETTNSMEYQE